MNKKNIKINVAILIIIVGIVVIFTNNSINRQNNSILNNFGNTPNPSDEVDLDSIKAHYSLKIEDEGEDIYVPKKNGYRYGPSIIYYDDGTMDMWFASNGNSSEWDWITYRHFDGEEWSKEEIVLKPTKGSKDHYSVCDPGIIFFNDYYYLGYTSTENAKNGGVENCCYVARSKNPNGPFEKWSGDGWGNSPEPIISYDENDSCWGAGELSFVVVEDKLYCYYSWISSEGTFTKLALADLVEDWPNTIEEKGIVIEKNNNQDSCDVVYVEELHKFLAFCIESRFMSNSGIAIFESDDGIDFKQVDKVKTNIKKYSHNMGISKMSNGHIHMSDNLLIGYAYSKNSNLSWGKWSTRIHQAKLVLKV